MNTRHFRAALTLACVLLAGRSALAAPKNYVYVHDRGNPNQVFGFKLTGANLTPIAGSPFATSAGAGEIFDGDGNTMAYSSVKHEIFVSGGAGISALTVNANGTLTELSGSPFGPASNYMGVAVVEKPGSTYVYAADFADGSHLRGFKVNSNGGLDELPSSPYATENGCFGLSAAGGSLFVACQWASVIDPFKVNNDGSLTGAPDPNLALPGVQPYNVFTSADGKFVYTPNSTQQTVQGFVPSATDASLLPIPGNPFAADTVNVGTGLAVGAKILFAFAYSDQVVQDIQVYARSKRTGALVKQSHISSGFEGIRSGATVGKTLIVASSTSDSVRTYKLGKKGKLTVADTETPTLGLVTHILTLKR
jgi:hypothetical protein